MEGLGMTFQTPEPLVEPSTSVKTSSGAHFFTLEDVDKSDNLYKEVSIDFENAGLTVTKIERLKNLHLYKRYVQERDLITDQRKNVDPDFKLNEKYLYHGTTADKSHICEEGLDSRMSKEGCFGKGIYFSDYPKKCVKYAERGGNDEFFILLMRVILGDAKVYPKGKKDRQLVREPEKSPPFKGYRFYDSVEGCPVNHKEFVVYESRRAIVECIITYSKPDKPEPDNAGVATKATATEKSNDYSDTSDSDSDNVQGDEPLEDGGENTSSDDDDDDAYVDTCEDIDGSGDARIIEQTSETVEGVLRRKRKEFLDKTGPVNDYIVDHCLLKSNLDIPEAIKIYENMPKDIEPKDMDVPTSEANFDSEIKGEKTAPKPDPPSTDSPEWANMNEDDQNAIIKGLVEDFLHVTGLEIAEEDYAKQRLIQAKNNLDIAILAHFEEISTESGQL